ncbi:MAG TPA: hypothetical protein VN706_15290 [Gemmatimonadaceae bacterium]|nr:hypothetical protein [Gemmatimonadaceae bacterium]
MSDTPLLRHYWFPASHGLGIGVTAPDAGTAWFAAKAALHRLPPGTTLTGQYVEDVDPQSLDVGDIAAPITVPGVWFPAGEARPVQIRVAPTPDEARSGFVFVADDGSARELTAAEADFLATAFDAGDGARPYVKRHYDSRTPDGRLLGFLPRAELPEGLSVRTRDS